MNSKEELETAVLMAARDYGIGTILFRNALAKKLGLNLTESLCLTILGIKNVSSPSELARYTGLTTGATTTMLDRLEKKHFLRRRANPDDRRGVLIEIDDHYSALAADLVKGIQKAYRDVIEGYSVEELAVIRDFLIRFTGNLTEESERISGRDVTI